MASSGTRRAVLFALALVGCALAAACGGSQGTPTTSTRVPSLAGKLAVFDDIEIDQSAHRLYVADRTDKGIDVFDVSTPKAKFLATIALPETPNGLAVAPGRVYAGTSSGALEIVDTVAGKVLSEVKTGAKEVDLIDAAPAQGLVFAGTGASGTLVIIDVQAGKVLSSVAVGHPLEQPRYDSADGMVYVSVPELDALAVIDPKAGAMKKTLNLNGCLPRGLALKPAAGVAVIACRKTVMSLDLRSGKTATFGNVANADVVQYYPSVDRFYTSAPHPPQPSLIGMYGGDPVGFLHSTFVGGGGNAAVYDETNDVIYTTDSRASSAGLTTLRMDGSRPTSIWRTALLTLGPVLLLVLLVIPTWLLLGRKADPINRRRRTPTAGAPAVVLAKHKVDGP